MNPLNEYSTEDWVSPKIELRESPINGLGMFAKSPITSGETVVVWGGTFVETEEAERARAQGKIVMQLDDDVYSIEEPGEDSTYFMNHLCDPNVWMDDRVTLVSRRAIATDEELTVDYSLFEANQDGFMGWQCVCGSPQCRKRITGQDWRLLELQARYAGHFLPLIAKRISG
jgi:SET domain-containing protein